MRIPKNIICGVSGGVDSAVSAYLLKKKGFNVTGAFMTNWDPVDEGVECSVSKDRADAQYVCNKLNIPFEEVNFVKHYWNDVFESVISSYERGWTPNPDILCNKFVKFKLFTNWAFNEIGCDAIATGHYARTSNGDFLDATPSSPDCVRLLRSKDSVKDQTFWLSQVHSSSLASCMFPLGNLLKPEVKKIAKDIGLKRTVERKESMGMCFIGKRQFKDFIDSYIPPRPGLFRLLERNIPVGEHRGIHHFTIGQRAPITVNSFSHYIARMDFETQDIFLVPGNDHPSLYMQSMVTDVPHWISPDSNPFSNSSVTSIDLDFQWQNKWRPIPCTVSLLSSIAGSKSNQESHGLFIQLSEPMRCVAPGQFAVLYDRDWCLGSALIIHSTSLWAEQNNNAFSSAPARLNSVTWNCKDYENTYS